VDAVERQDDHDDEVRDEDGDVEGVVAVGAVEDAATGDGAADGVDQAGEAVAGFEEKRESVGDEGQGEAPRRDVLVGFILAEWWYGRLWWRSRGRKGVTARKARAKAKADSFASLRNDKRGRGVREAEVEKQIPRGNDNQKGNGNGKGKGKGRCRSGSLHYAWLRS
jgi:hypothetical protein